MEAMRRRVLDSLFNVTADVLFMRLEVERALAQAGTIETIAEQWKGLSSTHGEYLQLRFLDPTGRELLRINDTDGGPVRVPRDELQDKSQRDYVIATLKSQRDDVLITPVDANREFGEIQYPVVPIMRFMTVSYGDGDQQTGIIIINFRAGEMLADLASIAAAARGTPFVVSSGGRSTLDDVLSGEADAVSLDGKKETTFASENPAAWEEMLQASKGALENERGDWITYERVAPGAIAPPSRFKVPLTWRSTLDLAADGPPSAWYIGLQIDAETIEETLSIAQSRSRPAIVLFLVLVFALSWMLALRISGLRDSAKHFRHRASRDPLTGLANRGEFDERLQTAVAHAKRYNRPMALLFIDLNDFKPINDTLGHAAGDQLLQHLAKVLQQCTRSSDVAARLGGDEFAIILSETSSRDDTQTVLDYVKGKLGEPVLIGGKKIVPSASIGAATYPEDGTNPDALAAVADRAMYEAKENRRGSIRRSRAVSGS